MKTDAADLNAFIDGELDLARQLDLETRVGHDAELRAQVEQLRTLSAQTRRQADYHAAPPALRSRVQALLAPSSAGAPAQPPRPSWGRRLMSLLTAPTAAWALVGVMLIAWGGHLAPWPPGEDERLTQEAIASHVRATLGQRLIDVESSDRHTVKPWLSARLDFSPPVPELQRPELRFIGGRIDYLGGRPVSTLVYRLRQHGVDVYSWPTTDADRPMRAGARRGFNVVHWTRHGMAFWVVSDLNGDELSALSTAFADAVAR